MPNLNWWADAHLSPQLLPPQSFAIMQYRIFVSIRRVKINLRLGIESNDHRLANGMHKHGMVIHFMCNNHLGARCALFLIEHGGGFSKW